MSEDVARSSAGRLAYDGFEPVCLRRPVGDVQARLEQRALELLPVRSTSSTGCSTGPCGRSPRPAGRGADRRRPRREPARRHDAASSSATATAIARLRLRTGSYANWPVVAFAAADNLLPDFPLINKSFELCYACADR